MIEIFFEDDELVISGEINKRVPYYNDMRIYTSTGQAWFAYRDDEYPEKRMTWSRGKYGFGAACVRKAIAPERSRSFRACEMNDYSDLIQYEHPDLMWVAVGDKCFINYSSGVWHG